MEKRSDTGATSSASALHGSIDMHYDKTGFKMKIYCLAPKSCDWFTDTAGSQGLQVMPRWQHVALEYTRIQRYLYGLATPKEVFHYYQTRETIS